jgi:hypothetical protein
MLVDDVYWVKEEEEEEEEEAEEKRKERTHEKKSADLELNNEKKNTR